MANFSDVLDVIEASPAAQVVGGDRARGTAFELATKYFLTHDRAWVSTFADVWMWDDDANPLRSQIGADKGIDLVAHDKNAALWAIQCKFYDADKTLRLEDVSTFFTTGHEAKIHDGHYIIAHTSGGFSKNLESAVKDYKAVNLDIDAFSNEFVDWSEFLPGSSAVKKFDPRPHQVAAIDDCLAGFRADDRGKLIMACGTGKTLTSLRLAEQMSVNRDKENPELANKPFRVLFCAPSISLVSQTFSSWTHQAREPMASFIVCSDSTANKTDDQWSATVLDIPFPTTTDSEMLRAHVQAGSQNAGLTVIFSTYQSIQATIDAQKAGMPDFDLVICDEAHRTAGASDNKQEQASFVKVHNQQLVHANKRLYMTATPRVYGNPAKEQGKREDYTLFSMDDEKIFGPEFHRLAFGKAVADNILTDYRVLVLGVSQSQASSLGDTYVNSGPMRALLDQIDATENKSRKPDRAEKALRARADARSQANSFAGKIVGTWNGLLTRGEHNKVTQQINVDTGLGEQVQFAVLGNETGVDMNASEPTDGQKSSLSLSL